VKKREEGITSVGLGIKEKDPQEGRSLGMLFPLSYGIKEKRSVRQRERKGLQEENRKCAGRCFSNGVQKKIQG